MKLSYLDVRQAVNKLAPEFSLADPDQFAIRLAKELGATDFPLPEGDASTIAITCNEAGLFRLILERASDGSHLTTVRFKRVLSGQVDYSLRCQKMFRHLLAHPNEEIPWQELASLHGGSQGICLSSVVDYLKPLARMKCFKRIGEGKETKFMVCANSVVYGAKDN